MNDAGEASEDPLSYDPLEGESDDSEPIDIRFDATDLVEPALAHGVDSNPKKRPRATVEEVEDEDERWVQPFDEKHYAGSTIRPCKTEFQRTRERQQKEKQAPWYPFEDEDEWELARWLMTSGVSQTKTDEYLKLKIVRERINPSFQDNRTFLRGIDALPKGPGWTCRPFKLVGDELDADGNAQTETVEMWFRDPVECVKELLANPMFAGKQAYQPCRVFKQLVDGELSNREYSEMWTADWWWDIQKLLPPGSTLAPIILASDKTQLTRFSGDKQAWPVYLTIGNIEKDTRRSPSSRAVVLLGYIPVSKLEIFTKKTRSGVGHQLFHDCMRVMLAPLKAAGRDGIEMDCSDGFVRRMVLRAEAEGAHPPEFKILNLRPIKPFWEELPHCDIFRCITPDLLHELHNGVFGDHIVKWATEAMPGGTDELDQRFRAMTPHPALRHFKKGISLTTQWTGTERKNMEKVFLGVLADATDPTVQLAVKAVLDFIYYAHFEVHCTESLVELDAAWATFHEHKQIFIDLDIRKNFNISKIHKLKHYVDSIRSLGTADGFNTEATERLHIDLAKVGYNASNKKAYTRQMTVWLGRQESVHKFGNYLRWVVPGYKDPAAPDAVDVEADLSDADEPPVPPEDSDDEEDLPSPAASEPTFTVAKKPPFPNLTADSIATDFHAPDFLDNIANFLKAQSIVPALQPTNNSTFPVYKRLSISLPSIPETGNRDLLDTIRAVKSEPRRETYKGITPAKAGKFDTVLVRVHPRRAEEGPTDGLCVARVRVIFRIPDDFGPYPDPLAYIDWFKPLQQPVPGLGMHLVSLSSRMHRQKSSIIPVSEITRSCHLIPVFGKSLNRAWTSDTVLDLCPRFYLNPYLRHHDFYLFRYQVAVHIQKKKDADRRVRMRTLGRAGRHG
ncbi:hypothetical protein B0H12DRAFT_1038122 [Mycena haematopus]|nr:hypothetical protein B0H12DRAFT_1038122 [Mycena haematopus]